MNCFVYLYVPELVPIGGEVVASAVVVSVVAGVADSEIIDTNELQ